MWSNLELRSTQIERVFKLLYDKVKEYDHSWSIAELKLADDDVQWLRSWFGFLTPENTANWIKHGTLAKIDIDAYVTYRQMFGSLLLCVAAELCREEGREDSVWPVIKDIFPESQRLRPLLFLSNGQPSALTKDIIMEAVRALNLRHAMDLEGTQQWFVTIKLQFGFTYIGAKHRLAEWLVNLGPPHAVQYLNEEADNSELTSKSFKSLWNVLKQYRRNLITEAHVRKTIDDNPWIKTPWIKELLEESKAKITTLGTADWHQKDVEMYEAEISREELCPIAEVMLEWPQDSVPRLKFHLDRQIIEDAFCGTELRELDFYVDGRKLCRWLRQKNGSWASTEHIYAEPDSSKNQPNLDPHSLALKAGNGEILLEWDFADSGLSKEVLVFDLEKETFVQAGEGRLDPNRRYAIICNRNCGIQECDPIEIFERNGISRKVIRLPLPLSNSLCITFEDFVLWQPVQSERNARPRFHLTLTTSSTNILSLNDRAKILLDGLPDYAKSVELLIHNQTYELQNCNGRWSTLKDVTIKPELAAHQRRVRIRFSLEGRYYTQEPRLAFRLLGSAMFRNKHENDTDRVSFEVIKKGDRLNRSEGTTYLRIWTPENDNNAIVQECNCLIGKLRHNKIKLHNIPGHGGELCVLSHSERYSLGVSCIETGCIRDFHPSMMGCDAQIFFFSDKNPEEIKNNGYVLYIWLVNENQKSKFYKLPDTSIQSSSSYRVWRIKDLSNPMAIALTWKGAWCGAWWDLEKIHKFINKQPFLCEQDFALVKWFRIPVLHPVLDSTFSNAILKQPCCFIKTWLSDAGLPDGLHPHENIIKPDSVIRHFLWNDFPVEQSQNAIAMFKKWDENLNQIDRQVNHLKWLSNISPLLLWKGLEDLLQSDLTKILNLLEIFSRIRVGLPSNVSRRYLNYRLLSFKKRVSDATCLSEERIDEVTCELLRSMKEKEWPLVEQDYIDMLKLGETDAGRQYLSANMSLFWLNLANH